MTTRNSVPPFLLFFLLSTLGACTTSPAAVTDVRSPDAPTLHLPPKRASPLAVTRVAHASVLLDFDGDYVLTDPWFTESSQYHPGEPLGIGLDALPRLTAVVASHGHYDHFDIEAFAAYPDKTVPFFVAPGMAASARRAGFQNVHELDVWQVGTAGPLTITAAPAEHGVPEVTFVLEGKGNTVFFGADTLAIPALDEVTQRFPRIDLALLSVNGLRAVGKQVVMSADEAAALTAKLRPTVAVPMHYTFRGGWFTETFILAYDGTPQAYEAAVERLAPETRVRILPPGQRLPMVHGVASTKPGGGTGI